MEEREMEKDMNNGHKHGVTDVSSPIWLREFEKKVGSILPLVPGKKKEFPFPWARGCTR